MTCPHTKIFFCPYKSMKPEYYSRQYRKIERTWSANLYTVSKPCKTPPIKSSLRLQSSQGLCGTTLVVPIYRLVTFHPSRFTHRPPESRRELCTISLDELCLPSSGCDWHGAGRGTPFHTSHCYMPCGWGLLPSQAQNSVPHQQTCTQHKTKLHLLVHALAADEYETTAKSAPEWQHMLIFVTLR